jgi:hypothetical protein
MNTNKVETVSAVNSYTSGLQKKFKGRFTLTQFDSEGIDIVQDNVKIKDIKLLTEHAYQPRGMTPLLDAIGKTMNAAKTKGFKNVIFCIVTDGEENASREYKLEAVRALIAEKREAGWQVAYIGADVDAFKEGASLGIAAGQSMNYGKAHASATMDSFLASNTRYAARSNKHGLVDSSVDFTDDERDAAVGGNS